MESYSYTAKKLTPWYPARIKPVRVGVYNVSCRASEQTGQWFAYWNGERFMYYHTDPRKAYRSRATFGCGADTKSWRGLNKRPRATYGNTK